MSVTNYCRKFAILAASRSAIKRCGSRSSIACFSTNKNLYHTTNHHHNNHGQLNSGLLRTPQNKGIISLTKFGARNYSQTQTDGDKDLVHFLKEEISYEEKNAMEVPQFRDFKLKMSGTVITLSREFNDESVEVRFDINENVNVDEELHADQIEDENINMPDIVSYPQFTVLICKSNGLNLHFNCTCNTGLNEDDGDDTTTEEDDQFDLFRFDAVKVYDQNTSPDNAYEAETDNMDGELYSMLMTTLLERGVNGVFINDLIDLSTTVEHRHYLSFLKSLKDFSSS